MRHLLLCSLLVGCGFQALPGPPAAAVDATVPTDAASALTPQAFITQLITEECVLAFACKPQYPATAPKTFDYEWGTDLNDCVTTDDDYLARDAIAAAVTAGRITFDPASAAICLAAPTPATCVTLFADTYDYADACYLALAGHVADGGACTTGWECGRASRCIQGACSRR